MAEDTGLLGRLIQPQFRRSENIEDIRANYTKEAIPGGGTVYTFDKFMPDTTGPWQGDINRTPQFDPNSTLGALVQSASSYMNQKSAEDMAQLQAALGPGVDVAIDEEGRYIVRKTPPMPERNPKRLE